MTAPLVAPLIPPRARPGGRDHPRAGAARRLPVAAPPEVPAVPDDVVYGFGRMDESGRVADRAMTTMLGWQPGDRLTLTASAGVMTARRDPGGMVTMPSKPYIVIPAALRRRCGLRPGDRVLLAVFPDRDALAAYSFAVVDQALRAHAPAPGGRSRCGSVPGPGAGERRDGALAAGLAYPDGAPGRARRGTERSAGRADAALRQ